MKRISGIILLGGLLSGCILLDEGLGIGPPASQQGEEAYNRISDAGSNAYIYGCSVWAATSKLYISSGGSSERTKSAFDCLTGDPNILGNTRLASITAAGFSGVDKSKTYKKYTVDDCARRIQTQGFTQVRFYLKGQEKENFVTNSTTSNLEQLGVQIDDGEFTTAALMAGLAAQDCILKETNPILETGR